MSIRRMLPTVPLLALAATFAAAWSPPAVAQEDAPVDASPVDRALDLYWAQKREIKTIQKRLFLKDSRWEFTLFSGVIPNNEFFLNFPFGGRINYFFNEDFSAELSGSYLFELNSDLKDFLEGPAFGKSLEVCIPQRLQYLAGGNVVWSPIHGKIALFTSKLSHFDLHAAFGVGAVGSHITDCETFEEKDKVDVSGNLGVGFRFYLTDWLSFRFDYRQFFYAAEAGGVAKPAEFTAGLSFWSDAPR